MSEETILKEVPMFTADEVEITVGLILYRVSWESGYSFKGEAKGTIEPVRVFYTNNSARQYRVKCAKGCESIYKVADGCNVGKLYGNLDEAKAVLLQKASKDLDKCEAKLHDVNKTEKAIAAEISRITKLKEKDLKLPRALAK